jgi:hypothetical protein
LIHKWREDSGAGSKRTIATNRATPERPLAKEFAAMLPELIEGNMNLRFPYAMPGTKTLTHQWAFNKQIKY